MGKGYTIRDRRGMKRTEVRAPAVIGPQAYGGFGLFATPRTSFQEDAYRPRLNGALGQQWRMSDYDWRELVGFSQQLFAQYPNIGRAIIEKNTYATGDAWRPHFKGDNQEWGRIVEKWLIEEWYPNCDIRGGIFDFNTNLFLSGIAWDVDGDDLMILTEDESGFPKLKFVPALCIGSRRSSTRSASISGGPYDGARECNGLLLDRDDRIIAINILGQDPADDMLIPAASCQLMFEPEFRCFHRGIPRMAKAILDAFDVQDIDGFLKRIIKRYASIAALHSTETGEPPPGSDLIVERTADPNDQGFSAPADVRIQRIIGGEDYFLSAAAGEKLEPFNFTTPSPNTEAFINRLERRSIDAVEWSYDLLDPAHLKGACVRLVQDRARHSVLKRQRSQKVRARLGVQYAVSRGMTTKRIPPNWANGDWMRWTFNLPAQITVDAGYDEQADRENFKSGTTTLAAISEKRGRFWLDTRRQRVEENKNLIESARELVEHAQAIGEELTFREALDLMQMQATTQRVETIQSEDDPNP